MNAKELAERYKVAVEEQLGLIAKITEDNDVAFKHPDVGNFFFDLSAENDPEHLRLVFPNFADKRLTEGDLFRLLHLLNQVNSTYKGVNLVMLDDDEGSVWASCEAFLAAPDQGPSQEILNSVIKRYFTALRSAIDGLFSAAKECQNQDQAQKTGR
jgi:hypothetical protein